MDNFDARFKVHELLDLIQLPPTLRLQSSGNSSAPYLPSDAQLGGFVDRRQVFVHQAGGVTAIANRVLNECSEAIARVAPLSSRERQGWITVFLLASLLTPLNKIMVHLLHDTGHALYWQVRRSLTGKPDLHLVWEPNTSRCVTLVVIEVMTEAAFTDRDITRLVLLLAAHQISVAHDGGAVHANQPDVARSHRSVEFGVLDQMRVETVMSSAPYAFISNYNMLLGCRRDHTSSMDVFFFDNPVSIHSPGTSFELAQSPAGLLLGVGLDAVMENAPDLKRLLKTVPPTPTAGPSQTPFATSSHAPPPLQPARSSSAAPATGPGGSSFQPPSPDSRDSGLKTSDYCHATTMPSITSPITPTDGTYDLIAEVRIDPHPVSLYQANPPSCTLPSPPSSNSVIIRKIIGSGLFRAAFAASVLGMEGIVKIIFLNDFKPKYDPEDPYTPTVADARAASAAELRALTVLHKLGVDLAPRLYAQCEVDDKIFSILDDAGQRLQPSLGSDELISSRIRNMYHALHAAGVLHGDVEWRHVREKDGKMRLIDFDRATILQDLPDTQKQYWDVITATEMDNVERMLCSMRPVDPTTWDWDEES